MEGRRGAQYPPFGALMGIYGGYQITHADCAVVCRSRSFCLVRRERGLVPER